MSRKLIFPGNNTPPVELSAERNIIIIGSNGCGKTRLGAWIDLASTQKAIVHRISAQKSLQMPDDTSPTSLERAEKNLLHGHFDQNRRNEMGYKLSQRWGGKPSIMLLNDFPKLMVYLFSDFSDVSAEYLNASRKAKEKLPPPLTKLDQIKYLWEKILPHRELNIEGMKITTSVRDDKKTKYNSSEMSDGERVIFYLIGQCLAAPKDGIIVIDEPELHINKSIQTYLWTEIEKLRSDCLFVYLTHDVDFAASMNFSKKIWLKGYDGENWQWEEIQQIDSFPEELLIQILGSRKNVVFVEGENGSNDVSLYRHILRNFLVIPRGSCSQVIQSVKVLSKNTQLHHLNVYGIIDRDRRTDHEIESLKKDNIYTLEVAEVENLFCTKEILEFLCKKLARDFTQDFPNVKKHVFKQLQGELENQITLRSASELKFQLSRLEDNVRTENELLKSFERLQASLNVKDIFETNKNLFEGVIKENNFEMLLKVYNRKSIASQISTFLDLKNGGLVTTILRYAKTDDSHEISECLKKYFGDFSKLME